MILHIVPYEPPYDIPPDPLFHKIPVAWSKYCVPQGTGRHINFLVPRSTERGLICEAGVVAGLNQPKHLWANWAQVSVVYVGECLPSPGPLPAH